jgi:hypothetical protein
MFKKFTNLKHLILNFNKIKFVNTDEFSSLSYLIGLSLSNNELSDLSFIPFKSISKLEAFHLGNNNFKLI